MIRKLRAIKDIFKDMDKVLLFIMIVLSVFGLFNIVTASSREAVVNLDQSVYYYFYKHLVVLVISLFIFIVIINVDTKKYYYLIPMLWLLAVGANLYLLINGVVTRGASNWIKFPVFNLQPSELSKPIIIAAVALYIERFGKVFRKPKVSHWNQIMWLFIIGLTIPAMVFFQKDLGTMIVQVVIFGIMYLLSPVIRKEKFKILGAVGCLVVVAGMLLYIIQGHILSESQLARLNYTNPCSKFGDDGYQVCNAYVAINLGGLTGVGIGKSTQKYSYIPEPHTDMVFSIVAEEYGFLFGVTILILYAITLYRILMLSSRANTIRGKYMCLGVAIFIFAHIFINLGGLFGIIPLTGLPLPFISYGGSFTLSLVASLAIVQRIHIETSRHKVKF